jgi:four helix bundle protein
MTFDLEERLINFSVSIIGIVNKVPKSQTGRHLSGQLIRSGTSVALNYGEAQSGESRKDFIHKLKIILKELRETMVCLKIIERTHILADKRILEEVKNENNELISIIVTSIKTARKNLALKGNQL